ncbi:hypothetical protein [Pseudomonas fluorescens]|uniref:hypothetical protein n=1 Tax=Pseudomonas fluorescens TaxID=294 RepID=UPI0012499330|nr:hypothetical protein [Pseudomonas fluorescens]CAG8870879.1 hypothetical protein PS861_03760 [Pseudomonas fluorescens]
MSQIQKDAAAGTLDPSFGDNGVVELVSDGDTSFPYSILPLADGKLLYANADRVDSFRTVKLRRLNANGFFDSSFGDNGSVTLPIGWSTAPRFALFSYPIDKILLKGTQLNDDEGRGPIVLARLDLNGQLDSTFGTNGIVTIDPYSPSGRENSTSQEAVETGSKNSGKRYPSLYGYVGGSVCVQPDGKVLVAHTGTRGWPDQEYSGLVLRLMPDGSLDKTFNETGFLRIKLDGIDSLDNQAMSIALQKDGKILVAGFYYTQISGCSFVVRYKEDGQLDSDFNKGLAVTIGDPEFEEVEVGTIAIRDNDGAIVVVGGAKRSHDGFVPEIPWIAVLNPSGSFNIVFNDGKPLFSKESPEWNTWQNCAWEEGSSSIIVAGGRVAARYLSSGLLDLSFNEKGWFARNGSFQEAKVTKDKKLVILGNSRPSYLLRCLL